MTGRKKGKLSCYICAASNSGAEPIQAVLLQLNVRSSKIDDSPPSGYSPPGVILRHMQDADFVCGVLKNEGRSASNVLFELGVAVGLSKPVFVIASVNVVLPLTLQAFPHVRASPSETDAIRFHLSAFVENMRSATTSVVPLPTRIGSQARRKPDRHVWSHFTDSLYDATESELVRVISDAFRSINASVVTEEKVGDSLRADIVAWLDDPTASLGEPILVEVKRSLGRQAVEQGIDHARKYMETAHVRTALLVTTSDLQDIEVRPAAGGFVFVMSVRALLDVLAEGNLVQQLVEARNRFAHSVG